MGKSSTLLTLILYQRPGRFLPFEADEQPAPAIDYHLMRAWLPSAAIPKLTAPPITGPNSPVYPIQISGAATAAVIVEMKMYASRPSVRGHRLVAQGD
jgi:hypothetical protein